MTRGVPSTADSGQSDPGAAGTPEPAPVAPPAIAGIGLDAVEVSRLRTSVERTPTLVDRVFTAAEQADCRNEDGSWRYWKLAARFAAKEAVAKAFGTGLHGFDFADVEVRSDANGRPEIHLAGPAIRAAGARGVGRLHVSLTHTGDLALASVVAEAARPGGEELSGR